MDNFEGGTTKSMTTTNVTPTRISVQPQISSPGEFEMRPEREMSITRIENSPNISETKDNESLSRELLQYAKAHSPQEALKKLAFGQDFSEQIEANHESVSNEREDDIHTEGSEFEVSENKTANQEISSTEFSESNARKDDIIEYIADVVNADPLFKQKLGEVASEMIATGQDIDSEILRAEAMDRYIAEKNEGMPAPFEAKIVSIEEQFADLLGENEELREELQEFKSLVKQQSETMSAMAIAMLEMVKKMHKEKEDEEEKITMLELMIKLMGLMLQEFVKTDEQNKQQQAQYSNQVSGTVLELPRIALKSKPRNDSGTEVLTSPKSKDNY